MHLCLKIHNKINVQIGEINIQMTVLVDFNVCMTLM